MGYVGNQTTNSYTSMDKQTITGNGGTSYTLDHAVANVNEIEVFVNNVRQEPSVAYTVAGTALTMTGNVASSDDFYVVFQGKALQTVVPPDGSVTNAKIDTMAASKLTGTIADARMPTGSVLQVKSATKTDKQSTTSSTPSDITGLSVSITPTSTSSKILVITNINFGGDLNMYGAIDVLRGSSKITEGSYPTGNQVAATIGVGGDNDNFNFKIMTASHNFLDSPASTSALTYKVQFASTHASKNFTINAPDETNDAAWIVGGTSTITVMEIAG